MREKRFDPLHLEVRRFADQQASLEGEIPVAKLLRLAQSLHAEAPPEPAEMLSWQASGEARKAPGSAPQPWLQLQARCTVRLTCQRCLQAVETALVVDREFHFVADEAAAAALDIDADEDVLVESRAFNLLALIEDEMLLVLPLVPRHAGACPQPLRAPADPAAAAIEVAASNKPFAALAGLKVRKATD